MTKSRSVHRRQQGALVNDADRAIAILRNVNWNFYGKGAFFPHEIPPFNCRKYHWYPATFVAEIPFTLIEVLTLPGAVVYDPFGGIGTTYFQALLLNRRPLTTEICRVSVEYMKSLFVLFHPEMNGDVLSKKVQKLLGDFRPGRDYTSDVPKGLLIDRLKPWFSERTLSHLCFLFGSEERCRDRLTKAAMRICISARLKAVSSQDRGWGCIADNVLPKQDQIKDKDVLNSFRKHINALLKDISHHLRYVMPGYGKLYKELSRRETIFHRDVKECEEIADESIDLVVTSPPYPNMTDYVTSQRLSYYFLGFDLNDKKSIGDADVEIGARIRRRRVDSIKRYFGDMRRANELVSQKIKKGGYACYVMPVFSSDNENNRNRRLVVQKVLSSMNDFELIKEEEFERILPTKRRSHNIKWATLEREKIYLFRKG